MSIDEIEILGAAFVVLALCAVVAVAWALRPSPADDLEDAYLDELIERRGVPAWRRGAAAYDHEKET